MAEMESGSLFAFEDQAGTFVLDILNSRPFRARNALSDIVSVQPPAVPAVKKNFRPLDYVRAQLCVTHACNLRCLYCELDGVNTYDESRNMDLSTAQKAIRTILASKPPEISKVVVSLTSNGEPLINLAVIDALISWCDDLSEQEGCRFSFNFATNATLLDTQAIGRILSHDNLTIFFSLDGSER